MGDFRQQKWSFFEFFYAICIEMQKIGWSFCWKWVFLQKIVYMPRGRDKELIKRRDEALCRRYYYWTEVQRLRFDDALKVLSKEEFFISEERILAIIRRKCKELDDIAVSIPARIKKPRLTLKQLELFSDEAGESISALRKTV